MMAFVVEGPGTSQDPEPANFGSCPLRKSEAGFRPGKVQTWLRDWIMKRGTISKVAKSMALVPKTLHMSRVTCLWRSNK